MTDTGCAEASFRETERSQVIATQDSEAGAGLAHAGANWLGAYPDLVESCCLFLNDNLCFESSTVLDQAIDAISKSVSLTDAFRVPFRYKILDYDAGLRWVHFLTICGPKIMASSMSENGSGLSTDDRRLRVEEALVDLAEIFDLAVQDLLWECVCCADSEDSKFESAAAE